MSYNCFNTMSSFAMQHLVVNVMLLIHVLLDLIYFFFFVSMSLCSIILGYIFTIAAVRRRHPRSENIRPLLGLHPANVTAQSHLSLAFLLLTSAMPGILPNCLNLHVVQWITILIIRIMWPILKFKFIFEDVPTSLALWKTICV